MENVEYLLLVAGLLFCSYGAIVAKRVVSATLFLAGISVIISTILYLLGAYQIAVIELSVGAGLVTVLLVYAVSVVGEDALDPAPVISKPFALMLIGAITILLGRMIYPFIPLEGVPDLQSDLAKVLWQERVLDVYIQIALIFSGVLGILGLLSERSLFGREKRPQNNTELSKSPIQAEELHT